MPPLPLFWGAGSPAGLTDAASNAGNGEAVWAKPPQAEEINRLAQRKGRKDTPSLFRTGTPVLGSRPMVSIYRCPSPRAESSDAAKEVWSFRGEKGTLSFVGRGLQPAKFHEKLSGPGMPSFATRFSPFQAFVSSSA